MRRQGGVAVAPERMRKLRRMVQLGTPWSFVDSHSDAGRLSPNAQVPLRASQIKASEASHQKIARLLQRTLDSRTTQEPVLLVHDGTAIKHHLCT